MISAHVLECSHMFCEHCILTWLAAQLKANGKQGDSAGPCPVCRAPITDGLRGIKAVDSAIEKMVVMLSPDEQAARARMVAEAKRTLPGLRQIFAKAKANPQGKIKKGPITMQATMVDEDDDEEDDSEGHWNSDNDDDDDEEGDSEEEGLEFWSSGARPYYRGHLGAPSHFQYYPEKPRGGESAVYVEYAKSGQAKCKLCYQSIPIRSLRFKIGTTYYHIHCLAPAHRDGTLLKANELRGLETLTRDDQAVVHAMLD